MIKKLTSIIIIPTILFASCNSSKYYFKIRGFGNAKNPIEKIAVEPNEISLKEKTEKDSSVIQIAKEKEIVKEEIDLAFDSKKDPQTEVKTQRIKENTIQSKTKKQRIIPVASTGVEKIKHSVSAPRSGSFKEKRFRHQQTVGKSSSVDWGQAFLDTLYVIGLLCLIAIGLAMEGTLTVGAFLGVVLVALLGAVLFGFLIWLLFHNFFDGIRESRSKG